MNVRDLFAYDRWANERLLSSLSRLTTVDYRRELNGSLSSVQQQAFHLISVPDRYRARLVQEPVPDLSAEQFPTAEALLTYAQAVAQRLEAFAQSFTDADLTQIIRHQTRRGDFVLSLEDTLWHMVNHSTYHRGQLAMLLKLLNVDYPDTDIVYWRSSLRHGENDLASVQG